MGLEPMRLHAFHILADRHDLADIHCVRREGLLVKKLFQRLPVQGMIHHIKKPATHIFLVVVADSFNQ